MLLLDGGRTALTERPSKLSLDTAAILCVDLTGSTPYIALSIVPHRAGK